MKKLHLLVSYRIIFTCLVLLLSAIGIHSRGERRCFQFTQINGLPRNITTCIEQDKYGYLWIGTGNGIARYDGNNFKTYDELSSVSIIDLLNDPRNNLWVCSDQGLYKYNRLTDSFEMVLRGYVSKALEDNGEIYFFQSVSINKIKGKNIANVYTGENLSDFCFSKEGLWVGTINEGLRLFSRSSRFKEKDTSFLENKHVSYITEIDNIPVI